MRFILSIVVPSVAVAALACGGSDDSRAVGDSGSGDTSVPDGGGGGPHSDGGADGPADARTARDGPTTDGPGLDATPNEAAAPDGGGDAARVPGFTDPSSWASYDLASILGNASGGFAGAAFDGHYLYLAPYYSDAIVRVDTQGPFSSSASYATMSGAKLPSFDPYQGAVFDGRYVYYVPSGGRILRYDSQAAFDSASSYASFDLASTGAPPTTGFSGGTFDGRYVYFAPQGNNAFSGYAVRFDTEGSFSSASSYQAFDMATVDGNAVGFMGAAFDGRYVTFSPWAGDLARYDTKAAFDAGGFTFYTPSASAAGAVFDGRFLTFAPDDGPAALYDTQSALDAGSSWSSFDPSQVVGKTQAYHGAIFDGRYVYVAPQASNIDPGKVVIRRDTQGAFIDPGSWATFDVGTLNPSAGNFFNGAFDGTYVYFVPFQSTVLARFDTGATISPPTTSHGSFY